MWMCMPDNLGSYWDASYKYFKHTSNNISDNLIGAKEGFGLTSNSSSSWTYQLISIFFSWNQEKIHVVSFTI